MSQHFTGKGSIAVYVPKLRKGGLVDPLLDNAIFAPILANDAEAVAFAEANRGLLSVNRTGVHEALRRWPRSIVRDALRAHHITWIRQTEAHITAGARALLPLLPQGTVVNNDLRMIGSAVSEGILSIATADVQFAIRAARAGIVDVQLRSFEGGAVTRIWQLGLWERHLAVAARSGYLTAAQRAAITIT